jgi:hypothetical protein
LVFHPINKETSMVDKVIATPAALELVAQLQAKHGPQLMFHQSGGCPFYIGRAQYETWKHTQLIIDVIEGTGGTFSLEGPEGKAFHTRSRVFTAQELEELEKIGL